jgi:hypothetical protein
VEPVNQHFLQLQIIPEYGKSPPRNPGLFGREHLIASHLSVSSTWLLSSSAPPSFVLPIHLGSALLQKHVVTESKVQVRILSIEKKEKPL